MLIEDTKAPTFTKLPKVIRVNYGDSDYNFKKKIKAKDLSKLNITVDTKKVDFYTPGTYKVTVKAQDIYGNATKKKLKSLYVIIMIMFLMKKMRKRKNKVKIHKTKILLQQIRMRMIVRMIQIVAMMRLRMVPKLHQIITILPDTILRKDLAKIIQHREIEQSISFFVRQIL